MKLQESYFSIIKNTKLPQAALFYNNAGEQNEDEFTIGEILKDTKLAWLANRSRFNVIDLNTGSKIASWNFGAVLSDFQVEVRWAVELPTPLVEDTKQLVIGLQCEVIGGMVCIFHCNGSRVLRCIKVNCLVSHLTAFDSIPDGPLDCFDGVIVVGTESGLLLAVDMNREKCIQAIEDSYQGNVGRIYDELNMAEIAVLPMENLARIREKKSTLEEKQHIAVQFNEKSFQKNQFLLHNPNETIRLRAAREKVVVTTMLYISQLGSVVVGFNFGAFQIWNLLTMTLDYTSPVNVECLPVTELGFQEPSDDPRAFCYLWVVYSTNVRYEEGFPLAVLYSLSYNKKLYLSDTLYLYEGLLNCNLRYQIELTCSDSASSPIKNLIGGRSIRCHSHSINTNKNTNNAGEDSVLNICQLVWECWTGNPTTPIIYVMLLFDLDQWYKDQLPGGSEVENNTFLSVVNVSEVALVLGRLCDVRIDCATISPYQATVQRLEEHFYPNSLGYECVCLSVEESTRLSTVGVQRQLVCTVSAGGPSLLLTPTKLYQQCLSVGLVPLYAEHLLADPTIPAQRQVILSIALEARLLHFLSACVYDWATGSHSGAGCTLHFFLDWCWQRSVVLKRHLRELTAPLFYKAGQVLDSNARRCLEHCVKQLKSIASLFETIGEKCSKLIIPDVLFDIAERHKAVAMVALYFQAVQWFLSVGLLPELYEHEADQLDRLPYPLDALIPFYQNRRFNLHRLNGDTRPSEELENRSCPLLYIDQLIDKECGGSALRNIWLSQHSVCEGVYPPPSLQALLKVYQLPDLSEQFKHCLVLYMLVDYSSIYAEVKYEAIIRKLMQFPAIFGLSNSTVKATEAFWNLDHQNFDFALDQLQCLPDKSLPQWQHSVVLSALHSQSRSQAALQYIHMQKPAPAIADEAQSHIPHNGSSLDRNWRTCYSLYLNRGLVFEAFSVVRDAVKHMEPMTQFKMFSCFFKSCKEMNLLSKLLYLSIFSPIEEEIFVKFLEDARDKQCDDILVMFYLEKSRYIEARTFNNSLRPPTATDRFRYNATRDILVDLYCNSLPNITHRLANCIQGSHTSEVDIKMVIPTPMSVFVQNKGATKQTYKSTSIEETIQKTSEIWRYNGLPRSAQKRKMIVEETPFVCTPKVARRNQSHISLESANSHQNHSISPQSTTKTPPMNLNRELVDQVTPKTDLSEYDKSRAIMSAKLARDIETFLDIPSVERQELQEEERNSLYHLGVREATPHSILKSRRPSRRETAGGVSPVDSRYLNMSEDEDLAMDADTDIDLQDQTSQHSETSKCLRFTIPNSASTSPSVASTEPNFNVNKGVVSQLNFSLTDDSLASQLSEDGLDSKDSKSPVLQSPVSQSPVSKSPMLQSPVRRRTDDTVSRDRTSGEGVVRRSTSLTESPISWTSSNRGDILRISDSYSDLTCDRFRVSPPQKSITINTTHLADVGALEKEIIEDAPFAVEPAVMSSQMTEVMSSPIAPPAPSPRRSMRSRSRTPEPTRPVEESVPARRNLRSRSKTPEVEITPATPERILRSPRIFQSTVEKSRKKKPLARLILEQNTFSKSKVTEAIVLDQSNTTKESDNSDLLSPNRSCRSNLENSTRILNYTMPDFSPINDNSILKDDSQSMIIETPLTPDMSMTSVSRIATCNIPKLNFSPINDKSVLSDTDTIIVSETPSPSTSRFDEQSSFVKNKNILFEAISVLKDCSSSFAESASENVSSDVKNCGHSDNIDECIEQAEQKEDPPKDERKFHPSKEYEKDEMAESEIKTVDEVFSEYTQPESQQNTPTNEKLMEVNIVRDETPTRVIKIEHGEGNSQRISDRTKAEIQKMLGKESKFAQDESKMWQHCGQGQQPEGEITESGMSTESDGSDSSDYTRNECNKTNDGDIISLDSSNEQEKSTKGASAFMPETDIANLEQSQVVKRYRSFLSGDKILASDEKSPPKSFQKSPNASATLSPIKSATLSPNKSANLSPHKSPSMSPTSVITKAGKKSFEDIYSYHTEEVSLLESDDSDSEMELQYEDDDKGNSVEESDSADTVTTSGETQGSGDIQESGDSQESSDVPESADTQESGDTIESGITSESGKTLESEDALVEEESINATAKIAMREAVEKVIEAYTVKETPECVENIDVSKEDKDVLPKNQENEAIQENTIIEEMETEDETLNKAIIDIDDETLEVPDKKKQIAVTFLNLSPILKPPTLVAQNQEDNKPKSPSSFQKQEENKAVLEHVDIKEKEDNMDTKDGTLNEAILGVDIVDETLQAQEESATPRSSQRIKVTHSSLSPISKPQTQNQGDNLMQIDIANNSRYEKEAVKEKQFEVQKVSTAKVEKKRKKPAKVTSRELRSISESSDSLKLIIAETECTPTKQCGTSSTRSRSMSVEEQPDKLITEENTEIQKNINEEENHGTEETLNKAEIDIDHETSEVQRETNNPSTQKNLHKYPQEMENVQDLKDEKKNTKPAKLSSRKLCSVSESPDSMNLIIVQPESTPTKPFTRSTRSRSISVDEDSTATSVTVPAKRITRLRSRENSTEKDKSEPGENISKDKPVRSTRRSSRTLSSEDDNASVASDDSSGSKTKRSRNTKKKADTSDTQLRKRISKLAKPDLSVIPEMSIEESRSSASMLGDLDSDTYSTSRRLTRHQRSMLSHSVELTEQAARVGRNTRSGSAESDIPEEKEKIIAGKVRRGPSLETGSIQELRNRRLSVDSEASPTSDRGADLAERPRRMSFHKAIEALITPNKGRRSSTDSRKSNTPEPGNSAESSPTSVGTEEANMTPKRSRRSSLLTDSPKSLPRSTRKRSHH